MFQYFCSLEKWACSTERCHALSCLMHLDVTVRERKLKFSSVSWLISNPNIFNVQHAHKNRHCCSNTFEGDGTFPCACCSLIRLRGVARAAGDRFLGSRVASLESSCITCFASFLQASCVVLLEDVEMCVNYKPVKTAGIKYLAYCQSCWLFIDAMGNVELNGVV